MDSPLKKLRLARGLTLQDVCHGTDIDTGTLSRIERGLQVSVKSAEVLVKFYGKGISELEILYPERYGFIPDIAETA